MPDQPTYHVESTSRQNSWFEVLPTTQAGQPSAAPPYDSLYICTGFLEFDFHSNNGERRGLLVLDPLDEDGFPILNEQGVPLNVKDIGRTERPRVALAKSAVASLTRVDNIDDDNGIWTVESAELAVREGGDVVIKIIVRVRGADGIHLRGVNYIAFLYLSSVT
jgi:hypothetical protein